MQRTWWQEACLIQGTEEASGIGGLLGVGIGGVCGGEEGIGLIEELNFILRAEKMCTCNKG